MSAEGERRADAGSPAFGADEVENVLAHLQHPIEAADVAGGRADQDLHARFPVPRWCCGPILRAAHPLRSAGSRSQVSGAISPTICRPFVGCQPHGANLLRRLSQAPQRAGRSKPRNSTAHSLSRCDGQVRTRRNPRDSAAFGAWGTNLSATGATARFAPRRARKPSEIRGFPAAECDGGCELRTQNHGQSLAMFRAAPPVPVLGQEGPAISVT